MDSEVLDYLDDLGYIGKVVEEASFNDLVNGEEISADYTRLISHLVAELSAFYSLEEASVNAITNSDESSSFLLELSGFMREYGCPHSCLTEGALQERLDSSHKKLLLLHFLTSELQAARIVSKKSPQLLNANKAVTVEIKESELARKMRFMIKTLEMNKPPDTITAPQFFSKLEPKISEKLQQCPPDHLGKSLLKNQLTEKQWSIVENMISNLNDEYKVRRELLQKRLDVTIQSFKWSEKAKKLEDKITASTMQFREQIRLQKSLNTCSLLAARDDLLRLTKTASGDIRARSSCRLNKVLMGRVPDRGGRAWELEPPPPEMPSFQKRDASGDNRGGRGGGRGRGGGDFRGGGRGGHQDYHNRPQSGYQDYHQQGNSGWRPQSAGYDAMGTTGGGIIFTPQGGAPMQGGYQFQPQYNQYNQYDQSNQYNQYHGGGGGGRGRGRGGRRGYR